MAFRDRTSDFVRMRSGFRSHSQAEQAGTSGRSFEMKDVRKVGPRAFLPGKKQEDKARLLSSTDDDLDLEAGLGSPEQPSWITEVEYVKANLAKIKVTKKKLQQLHQKRLRPGFGDEDAATSEVDEVTNMMKKLFKDCEEGIKQIGLGVDPNAKQDVMMRGNAQRALVTELHALSSSFRREQNNYLCRIRGHEEETVGYKPTTIDRVDGDDEFSAVCLHPTEAIAEERAKEIDHIVKSVNDLSTMFKELAVLVIDQGTIIDRIDYNVELVQKNTADAVGELDKARRHAESGKLRCCIICLAVAVAVMVILLILKIASKFE